MGKLPSADDARSKAENAQEGLTAERSRQRAASEPNWDRAVKNGAVPKGMKKALSLHDNLTRAIDDAASKGQTEVRFVVGSEGSQPKSGYYADSYYVEQSASMWLGTIAKQAGYEASSVTEEAVTTEYISSYGRADGTRKTEQTRHVLQVSWKDKMDGDPK